MRFRISQLFVTLLIFYFFFNSQTIAQDESQLGNMADAAGMFNERGYLKSNSFSYDGNEIVNDFNGNLMYSQILEYIPLSQNGLNFELKLAYNGSVGHMSTSGIHLVDGTQRSNSINMPAWIFSINNIAVQTMNFENEAVSWGNTTSDTLALDEEVNALVNGYHVSYKYNNPPYGGGFVGHGTMSILMGDGSVLQLFSLENDSNNPSGIYVYKIFNGEYRTLSKDDKTKGFMDSTGVFTLFREDGTIVKFRYYRPKWKTNPTIPFDGGDALHTFIPYLFLDQFHNTIMLFNFDEDPKVTGTFPNRTITPWGCCGDTIYGRPPLSYIDVNNNIIRFNWNPVDRGASVVISKDNEFRYNITADNFLHSGEGITTCGLYNRAYIRSIIDAVGRETEFHYNFYKRVINNAGGYPPDDYQIYDCDFDTASVIISTTHQLHLQRLNYITYPDGERTFFSYYNDQRTEYPPDSSSSYDFLTVDATESCQPGKIPCTRSVEHINIGRDPFYNNMVTAIRRVDTSGSVISVDSLIFSWYHESQYGFYTDDDIFYTKRYYWDGGSLYDFNRKEINLTYKQYGETGFYNPSSRDRGWSLKLIERKQTDFDGTYDNLMTTQTWDIADSTLMLLSKTLTKEGISTTTNYGYGWDNGSDKTNSNILSDSVTDAWGNISINFYNNNYFNVANPITNPGIYYTNSLIDSSVTRQMINSTEKDLQKSKYEYSDSTDTIGYVGLLKSTTSYELDVETDPDSSLILDSLTKRYEYSGNGRLYRKYSPAGDVTEFEYGTNFIEGFQLNYDSSVDTLNTQFPFHPTEWSRMDLYKSDTTFGWIHIDTIIDNYEIVTCEVEGKLNPLFPEVMEKTTLFTTPCPQTVYYYLDIRKNHCLGIEGDVWIQLNGVTIDSLYCDIPSGVGDITGSISVIQGDIIEMNTRIALVDTLQTFRKSSAYAHVLYVNDCSVQPQDTLGIKVDDKISFYQETNKDGILLSKLDANRNLSSVNYDNIYRVNEITLPGSYMSSDFVYELPTYPETLKTFYPTLDGVLTSDEGNVLLNCADTALTSQYFGEKEDFIFRPLFMFGDLVFDSTDKFIDSAFLVLNVIDGSGRVKINSYKNNDIINCGDSIYNVASTNNNVRDVAMGEVRLNIITEVLRWSQNLRSEEHTSELQSH